uniref:Transmembrane protein 139 n=1 Tax=Chelonoidis abingdonii TaxID=106734 RepID=A0A8C0J524_CHEAB
PVPSQLAGIRRALLFVFTATLLIGVIMLALSSNINPVGFFFLGVGGVCLIGYLLSVFVEYFLKHRHSQDTNQASMSLSFVCRVNSAYEAPAYEEVVTMTPAPTPPPYSVVIEPPSMAETGAETFSVSVASGIRRASEADAGSRLHLRLVLPPRMQRFVSDIHDVKGAEERLEPLTPPPAYESPTDDDVFAEAFQPSRQ